MDVGGFSVGDVTVGGLSVGDVPEGLGAVGTVGTFDGVSSSSSITGLVPHGSTD